MTKTKTAPQQGRYYVDCIPTSGKAIPCVVDREHKYDAVYWICECPTDEQCRTIADALNRAASLEAELAEVKRHLWGAVCRIGVEVYGKRGEECREWVMQCFKAQGIDPPPAPPDQPPAPASQGEPCGVCGGTGKRGIKRVGGIPFPKPCPACKGTGQQSYEQSGGSWRKPCPACKGSGTEDGYHIGDSHYTGIGGRVCDIATPQPIQATDDAQGSQSTPEVE